MRERRNVEQTYEKKIRKKKLIMEKKNHGKKEWTIERWKKNEINNATDYTQIDKMEKKMIKIVHIDLKNPHIQNDKKNALQQK